MGISKLEAYTKPRTDIVDVVPTSARRILELGCSTGSTGAVLKERQPAEVVGIEADPEYVRVAAAALDSVLELDLDGDDWADRLEGEFDCIIAGDVLEHLRDPWKVLSTVVKRLTGDGVVVIGAPNIRHVSSLVPLVLGRWPYRERGIHDATHLRFFTLHELRGLCASAGLRVERVVRKYRFRDQTSKLDRYARAAGRTPLRDLFAYQYLLVCRRGHEGVDQADESVPAWVRGSR